MVRGKGKIGVTARQQLRQPTRLTRSQRKKQAAEQEAIEKLRQQQLEAARIEAAKKAKEEEEKRRAAFLSAPVKIGNQTFSRGAVNIAIEHLNRRAQGKRSVLLAGNEEARQAFVALLSSNPQAREAFNAGIARRQQQLIAEGKLFEAKPDETEEQKTEREIQIAGSGVFTAENKVLFPVSESIKEQAKAEGVPVKVIQQRQQQEFERGEISRVKEGEKVTIKEVGPDKKPGQTGFVIVRAGFFEQVPFEDRSLFEKLVLSQKNIEFRERIGVITEPVVEFLKQDVVSDSKKQLIFKTATEDFSKQLNVGKQVVEFVTTVPSEERAQEFIDQERNIRAVVEKTLSFFPTFLFASKGETSIPIIGISDEFKTELKRQVRSRIPIIFGPKKPEVNIEKFIEKEDKSDPILIPFGVSGFKLFDKADDTGKIGIFKVGTVGTKLGTSSIADKVDAFAIKQESEAAREFFRGTAAGIRVFGEIFPKTPLDVGLSTALPIGFTRVAPAVRVIGSGTAAGLGAKVALDPDLTLEQRTVGTILAGAGTFGVVAETTPFVKGQFRKVTGTGRGVKKFKTKIGTKEVEFEAIKGVKEPQQVFLRRGKQVFLTERSIKNIDVVKGIKISRSGQFIKFQKGPGLKKIALIPAGKGAPGTLPAFKRGAFFFTKRQQRFFIGKRLRVDTSQAGLGGKVIGKVGGQKLFQLPKTIKVFDPKLNKFVDSPAILFGTPEQAGISQTRVSRLGLIDFFKAPGKASQLTFKFSRPKILQFKDQLITRRKVPGLFQAELSSTELQVKLPPGAILKLGKPTVGIVKGQPVDIIPASVFKAGKVTPSTFKSPTVTPSTFSTSSIPPSTFVSFPTLVAGALIRTSSIKIRRTSTTITSSKPSTASIRVSDPSPPPSIPSPPTSPPTSSGLSAISPLTIPTIPPSPPITVSSPPTITSIPVTPTIRTPFDTRKRKSERIKRVAYSVQTKRKGKWTNVTRERFTRQAALDFGAEVTDKSLAATFRIRKVKTNKKVRTWTPYLSLTGNKFRATNKKGNPLNFNGLVERQAFRLDTPTEVKKIKAARLAKRLLRKRKQSTFNFREPTIPVLKLGGIPK